MEQFDEKRSKIRLKRDLLEKYHGFKQQKNEEKISRIKVLTEFCNEIAEGKHDSFIQKQEKKSKRTLVNVRTRELNQAREHIKALGYSNINELIEKIMIQELKEEKEV